MVVEKCDLLVMLKIEIHFKMKFEFLIFMLIFIAGSHYIRWARSIILKPNQMKQNRNYKKLTTFYDCVKNVYSEIETSTVDQYLVQMMMMIMMMVMVLNHIYVILSVTQHRYLCE